jgi:hypothetical protein
MWKALSPESKKKNVATTGRKVPREAAVSRRKVLKIAVAEDS